MDKQPNLNNITFAGKYLDQTYYITREPRQELPGDKFEVFHKHEGGYSHIGTFMLSNSNGLWVCHSWKVPQDGAKHFQFGTMEETEHWIFEQHAMWLKEQFEKAFSINKNPPYTRTRDFACWLANEEEEAGG